MAKKHIKRYSTIFGKCKCKQQCAITRCLSEWLKFFFNENTITHKDTKYKKSLSLLVGTNNVIVTLEESILTKLNIILPVEPAIVHPDICPTYLKNCIGKFIVVSFLIVKSQTNQDTLKQDGYIDDGMSIQ